MIITVTSKEAKLMMRMFIACITLRTIDWDLDDIMNSPHYYSICIESQKMCGCKVS